MANQYFNCVLDAWHEGSTLYARMHYWRSDGRSYSYGDSSFPNPTMNLAGTSFTDSAFGDRVRGGISVGDVYTTTFSRAVAGSGNRTVTFTAGSGSRSDFAGTWTATVNMPSSVTAPTGLATTNVTPMSEGFSGVVSVTGWGGAGNATNRRRQLQVWTYNATNLVTPRRIQTTYGNSLSSTIVVDNGADDDGGMTIRPNTRYTLGMWATNGTQSTGSKRVGNYVTLGAKPLVALTSRNGNTVAISYDVSADGGFYNKTIEYSVDNNPNWTNLASITGTSGASGTISLNNLAPKKLHRIEIRVVTTAGTVSTILYFDTSSIAFYGPDSNLEAQKADKIYGSVSNQATELTKLYGSVNGKTKLIHQSFGHLDYT